MPVEQMLWGVGLLLAASVIVFLNDKMRNKGSKGHTVAKSRTSWWELLIAIAIVSGMIALQIVCGPEATYLWWVFPLMFVALVPLALLFAWRKVIWLLLRNALTGGPSPVFMWKTKSGSMKTKCPRCAMPVQATEEPAGTYVFQCEHCGEKMTFDSMAKP
jgi:hypothetical protein